MLHPQKNNLSGTLGAACFCDIPIKKIINFEEDHPMNIPTKSNLKITKG
jgi:hypothetical protein